LSFLEKFQDQLKENSHVVSKVEGVFNMMMDLYLLMLSPFSQNKNLWGEKALLKDGNINESSLGFIGGEMSVEEEEESRSEEEEEDEDDDLLQSEQSREQCGFGTMDEFGDEDADGIDSDDESDDDEEEEEVELEVVEEYDEEYDGQIAHGEIYNESSLENQEVQAELIINLGAEAKKEEDFTPIEEEDSYGDEDDEDSEHSDSMSSYDDEDYDDEDEGDIEIVLGRQQLERDNLDNGRMLRRGPDIQSLANLSYDRMGRENQRMNELSSPDSFSDEEVPLERGRRQQMRLLDTGPFRTIEQLMDNLMQVAVARENSVSSDDSGTKKWKPKKNSEDLIHVPLSFRLRIQDSSLELNFNEELLRRYVNDQSPVQVTTPGKKASSHKAKKG